MIEVWKAVGMDLNGVEFVWSSEEINSRAAEYLSLVIKIAHGTSFSRIMRCVQIMGRKNQELLSNASIFYPCMQCVDVFFLKADICQLGMDQRKVNVLAREYCKDIKRKNKPIILSHRMSILSMALVFILFLFSLFAVGYWDMQICFQVFNKGKKRCQRVIHHLPSSWRIRRYDLVSRSVNYQDKCMKNCI
ncbi:hypothetical protein Ddye_021580 [Dipteronia dyeriana]|uniref:tyrosine--tRNA ligase n=1 Tax=Dipteronia dyeriana TaxID=168575 RepID=A0AAD9U1X3_9ROSI|nr:hypothetical protein Ddye_021580 [Dipteronia dyeriana]